MPIPTNCAVSRKYTFAMDSIRPIPSPNRARNTTKTITSGIQIHTWLPHSTAMTASTNSSKLNVTRLASMFDTISVYLGKYTFCTRLAFPSSAFIPPVTVLAKKFQGNSAQASQSVKMSIPLGSPGGGCARSTNPKTTV